MPKGRKEILESLLVRNFSRCRIADRIEVKETQGKILQICHSQGKIKIDKIQIVKDGILAEGIVRLKVLYIVENDDMPFYSMEACLLYTSTPGQKGKQFPDNIRQKESIRYAWLLDCGMGKCIPVSYTHLDVYKRQEDTGQNLPEKLFLFYIHVITFLHIFSYSISFFTIIL